MQLFIKGAGSLLKFLGCNDITFQNCENDPIVKMTAHFNNTSIIARVQLRPEWGTDVPTKSGGNWKDARYPYASMQFGVPEPVEGETAYTHYIIVSPDGSRACLATAAIIKSIDQGWSRSGNGWVPTVTVPNYTPKLGFFVRKENGWMRDPENVWKEPEKIPASPDEFLASL